jgi:hypothetical protein
MQFFKDAHVMYEINVVSLFQYYLFQDEGWAICFVTCWGDLQTGFGLDEWV